MKTTILSIVLFSVMLMSPNTTNAGPAVASGQYEVRTHVLSVYTTKDDKLELRSSKAGIFGKDAEGSTPSFMDLKEIRLKEHIVEFGTNGEILWDGQPKPPSNSPFQYIGGPSVITIEGQKSSVIQADPVEYFEKSGNAYTLGTTPPNASPSISIDFVIDSTGGEQVKVDFHLLLSVMTGRKKLTSTTLDVGEPILKKKDIPLKLDVPLGKWLIPSLFVAQEDAAGHKEYLIVLMLIRRLK